MREDSVSKSLSSTQIDQLDLSGLSPISHSAFHEASFLQSCHLPASVVIYLPLVRTFTIIGAIHLLWVYNLFAFREAVPFYNLPPGLTLVGSFFTIF